MSAATAELVADHLPVDASLVDLGDVRLRGLSRPVGVFGLAGRGVRSPAKAPRGEAPSRLLDDRGVTRREAEVLDALGDRLTNAEIASRLYLSGRTVESHVSSLLRKLGVASRLELADIAKELRAETPLGVPALPASLELLADRASYVGRRDERSRLLALWERASSGQALVAVVMGEAGMGKSRLTAEFASEVHSRGGRVLFGACFEDVHAPFQPFLQALGDDMAQLSDAELRRRVGSDGDALAHLLPNAAPRWGGRAPTDVLDASGERLEMFAAVHGYLARAVEKEPMLLVIEDLHWASATTRQGIQQLARLSGRAPLLIVVTTRDSAPDLDDRLAAFLSELGRLPSVEMVRLRGLDTVEVA
jgi:DNA-binding CsgD family transcriptional regulator